MPARSRSTSSPSATRSGSPRSVLYFGAIGDRYGTKAPAPARHDPRRPDVAARRVRAFRRGVVRRACGRRPSSGDGVSDYARPDRSALVRPGADEVDRAVVGDRRRDRGARAADLRCPARAVRLGIGVSRHVAAGRGGDRDGVPLRPEPRQRDHRAGRQPRRRPVARHGRGAHPLDQLRAGAERDGARARARRHRRQQPPSASTCDSAERGARSTTSTSPPGASSGWRRAQGSSSSARSWLRPSSASSTSRTSSATRRSRPGRRSCRRRC